MRLPPGTQSNKFHVHKDEDENKVSDFSRKTMAAHVCDTLSLPNLPEVQCSDLSYVMLYLRLPSKLSAF